MESKFDRSNQSMKLDVSRRAEHDGIVKSSRSSSSLFASMSLRACEGSEISRLDPIDSQVAPFDRARREESNAHLPISKRCREGHSKSLLLMGSIVVHALALANSETFRDTKVSSIEAIRA